MSTGMWEAIDDTEIHSEVSNGSISVCDDLLIVVDDETESRIYFYLPEEYRICRRTNKDLGYGSIEFYALIAKWGYNPLRRNENIAGDEPCTDKQRRYIQALAVAQPQAFNELSEILFVCWGVYFDAWTKADAMFVINSLLGRSKKS